MDKELKRLTTIDLFRENREQKRKITRDAFDFVGGKLVDEMTGKIYGIASDIYNGAVGNKRG